MGENYKGYRDLKVYSVAYQLALDIHEVTIEIPERREVFFD